MDAFIQIILSRYIATAAAHEKSFGKKFCYAPAVLLQMRLLILFGLP